MFATLNINNYPYFDSSEIVRDADLPVKHYKRLSPVKAGNILPDFTLDKENIKWQQFFNGAEVHGPALLRQLLNKPLVVGFYSNHWQQHGLDLLKQLNAIQQDIKANGGNLIIISAEKGKALEKIVWDNSLSLSFYIDSEKEIAEQFRIYSENDPIWNRFSGIDTNVPLLATYVISPSGQIEYDHIDPEFSKSFPAKEIIGAVSRYNGVALTAKNTSSYLKL